MIIAGVDPGLITGICVVEFIDVSKRIDALTAVDSRLIATAELEFPEVLDWCEDTFPAIDRVALEKFIITSQTGKNSQAPWSLEVSGIVKAIALRTQTAVVLQKPVDAISFVSNDLLRSLKLWHRGGAGHANDALRHAIMLAVRRGWRSPNLVDDTF